MGLKDRFFRLTEDDRFWNASIVTTAAAALLLNAAGLLRGFTVAIPHLLYIPVVLAAYRYPRQGLGFAGGIGTTYFLMTLLLGRGAPADIAEALVRAAVLLIIGGLVGFLALRLREQELLYRGLFDHSESGSLLVQETGTGRIIEAANWKASDLLRRNIRDIRGAPLSSIWGGDAAEDVFLRIAGGEAVYATETSFTLSDGKSFVVLVSAAPLSQNRAVLTFVDITDRVRAEQALQIANDKLGILSSYAADKLHASVDEILRNAEGADACCDDPGIRGYIDRIRALAWNIARQLLLTESYKDLGTVPPVWMSVQRTFETTRLARDTGAVAVRIWTERLCVYADALFAEVLIHLVENSLRHGGTTRNVVVTYHETADGLDLYVRDDGSGIPDEKKKQIFEYDAGGQAGIGLFICRQIAEVTGMTLAETGIPGKGACFVIHVPLGKYRIEGTGDDAPSLPLPAGPSPHAIRHRNGVTVRELAAREFPLADALWIDYHATTGDPRIDRIFAAFNDGQAVSIARCRKHKDGYEVDGVFTPVSCRGHGYANAAVGGLVEACGHDTLWMHSVRNLEKFYGTYGFVPVGERELPPTIQERFAWAEGEMEGANVLPMKRDPAPC